MYRPPAFRVDDTAALAAALGEIRLATLVTVIDGRITADPVPMLYDPTRGPHGTLLCHVARANPQGAPEADRREALVIVSGPDAYVSPGFYETKRETGRVVPTWNYVTLQARGRLRRFDDPERLLALVTALTDRHEAGRAEPWAVDHAPADFVAAQLRGIVGLEIEIAELVGKNKLSQNRVAADRAGVVTGLAASPDERDRAVAAAMNELD